MNSPRVIALQYRIEHDQSVDYSKAEPVDHDEEDFSIRIEDNRVRFDMKVHVATVDSAKDAVESYIRSWELDAALRGRPGQFKLRFDRSEIRDRNPTTGEMLATKEFLAPSYAATVTRRSQAYPEPPAGVSLKRNDHVSRMFARYEDYCHHGWYLTDMAYFCLTAMRDLSDRGDDDGVKREYGISGNVLKTFRRIANKGGPDERRKEQDVDKRGLTPDERRFLEEAVKRFIRRVAEVAQSPDGSPQKITLGDLPKVSCNADQPPA